MNYCKDCKHYSGLCDLKPGLWNLYGMLDAEVDVDPSFRHRCHQDTFINPITGCASEDCTVAREICKGNFFEGKGETNVA